METELHLARRPWLFLVVALQVAPGSALCCGIRSGNAEIVNGNEFAAQRSAMLVFNTRYQRCQASISIAWPEAEPQITYLCSQAP